MKKTIGLLLVLISFIALSCKEKVKPFSDRVAKVWVARIVKENSTIVYSNGGANNIKPSYSGYKLDLSSPPKAIITEVDGQTYTGSYSVQGENKIVVSGITPEPTGTGGVLEYNINSLNDAGSELDITLSTAYPKTGNTTNQYTLLAQ